jgi:hypothetical protein
MNIEYIGRGAIIDTPDVAFTYNVSETPRELYNAKVIDNLDWNERSNYIGDYIVYPFGANNDLPDIIKQVVQNNYITPGMLKKKTQLIWGLGPQLYKEKIINGVLNREWVEDNQISDWLHSWDYEDFLLKACTDYQHIEGVFSRFELNKGSRIGKPFISKFV